MPELTSEQSIFLHALGLPTPEARAAYLNVVYRDRPALRAELEALLAAHERLGGGLPPTEPEAAAPVLAEAVEAVGTTLAGRYQLLEPIGEGGMGSVWLAQQTEPVRRLVAVKLIKAGMDSRQVVARFEAERQALALMDHPNIAKVHDAGATPEGRPYFVMELVKGVPITRYCDERRLTPRQRLELFVPVCQAIQHAHQKGIIHRDLKPSNVLAALYDGKPVPKVIDFGVAKAAGQPLTDKTLVTGFGALVGTLEYMSPEQAEVNQLDIDTRSDVYALGVLLYELLTGSPPFSRKELEKAGMLELLRVIREQEPSKPSTKLSTAAGLPTLAANRGTEPAKLTRLVRGELDWIVMKALEKDRNRRYDTAHGFALDVQRYLADEPVLACPPSAGYRLRKFARRNKAGLVIAGLVLLLTAILGGGAGWVMRERSAQQTRTAGKVEEAVLESAEAYRQRKLPDALSSVRRALALLDSGAASDELQARVERWRRDLEFASWLEEADLQRTGAAMSGGIWDSPALAREFAQAFRGYGIDLDALSPVEAARRIADSPIREHLIGALDQWASLSTVTPGWKDRLAAVGNAADDDPWRRRLRSGARYDRNALQELAADVDARSPADLHLLGMYLDNQGDSETAVRLLTRAQRRYPSDFWINYRLGYCLGRVKPARTNEALSFLTAAVALRPESPGAHLMLAMSRRRSDLDGAEAAFLEAIRLQPTFAAGHDALGHFRMVERKDVAGALDCFTRAVELSPDTTRYREDRVEAYRRLKQLPLALDDANAAIAAEPGRPTAWFARGMVHRDMKRLEQAVADFTRALELMPDYHGVRRTRGFTYLDLGQAPAAIADFVPLLALPGEEQYLRGHAFAFRDSGQLTKAIAVFTALLTVRRDDANLWMSRGGLHHQGKKYKEAVEDYSAAIGLQPKNPNAWAGRGYAHTDARNREQALADLSRAIELDLGRGLRWLDRGKSHWGFDNQALALQDFDRAVELDPTLVEGWLMKGHANRRIGRLEPALAAYSEAVTRVPKDGQAWADRGRLLVQMGRWAKASADFEKAVAIHPHMPSAWHDWAAAELAAGNAAGHRKVCTAMLARFRDNQDPRIAERVVSACVIVPASCPEAAGLLQLAELAARAEGGDAALLGAARYRANQFRPALETLEQAGRSQPRRAWLSLFLAMTHHRLGNAREATAALREAKGWLAKVGPPPEDGGSGPRWFNWQEEVEVRALLREAEALFATPSNAERPKPR